MQDSIGRIAERPATAPLQRAMLAGRSPALARFIEDRADKRGPLGVLLRAAGFSDPIEGSSLEAELAQFETTRHGWLKALARIVGPSDAASTTGAAAGVAGLVRQLLDKHSRDYPLYGALAFVATSGSPEAVAALLKPLAAAMERTGAIGARLARTDHDVSDPRLAGGLLRSALRLGWNGAPLAAALRAMAKHATQDALDDIAATLLRQLPAGDERRRACLDTLADIRGRRPAAALATALAEEEHCHVSALFAAEQSLAEGRILVAGRLIASMEAANEDMRRDAQAVEQTIALRIATDRLRLATPPTRNAAADALADVLVHAVDILPVAHWWPSATTLVDHVIATGDLVAYDRLAAIIAIDRHTARAVAGHLFGAFFRGATSGAYVGDEAVALHLAAEARTSARFGRFEASLVLFRLALVVRGLPPAPRLEAAYVALKLGRLDEALAISAPLSRIHAAEIGAMPWPSDRTGTPWPHAPIPVTATLPPGVAWPRISVAVPSFNQAKYVRECLQSLVLQNYPDLEIIVFDAVSTDGTIAILGEFRDKVASLIVEPDAGQSDAINKGLSRATGELLHWLNTDDMLAPGACHAVALAYLRSKADIIAGACIEFSDREMRLLNLPTGASADFSEAELSKQFDRWLQGHYFYQPELFFSKRIWDLAGGRLNPAHHLAMDFDLWLRAARAGARYERIHWPVAFFRKHAEQKTSQLDDTIDEQAGIIADAMPQVPTSERDAEIGRRLAVSRATAGRRRVAVVTRRFRKIFSDALAAELADELADIGSVTLFSDPEAVDVAARDTIIHLAHVQADDRDITAYRARGFDGAVSTWFWDNHHSYLDNRRTAEATDIIVPGHAFCATYLANPKARLASPVPLCVTQWSRHEARAFFVRFGHGARSDQLSGGFVDYAISARRSRLVVELLEAGFSDALVLLKESDLSPYFGMSSAERFESWCNYKTSLCLPLRRDLSQRFFDGWLSGQVVVVPDEIDDILTVIPQDVRARHMVTFRKWTPEAVAEAQAKALALFDAGGAEGVKERHEIAASQHMFVDRIRRILERW